MSGWRGGSSQADEADKADEADEADKVDEVDEVDEADACGFGMVGERKGLWEDGVGVVGSHMLPFQRLDAWKLAHRFALDIREETSHWPREERYGLTEQIRRAALSISNNIAEGQAKRGSRELRKYLDISLGSFSETTNLLLFARDCGLMPPDRWEALEPRRKEVGLVLWRFYQSVARKSDP